jgi:hypothetical protein
VRRSTDDAHGRRNTAAIRPSDDDPLSTRHRETSMALSKSENKQFGDRCLPFLVRSVATDFGFDFRVCPRQMHVSPTVGLHITASRSPDARLSFPLNVFVFLQPSGVRRFLSHVDRPIAAARASEQLPDEIRRVMGQSGVDFAGRSQEKGEVMMVALGDISV